MLIVFVHLIIKTSNGHDALAVMNTLSSVWGVLRRFPPLSVQPPLSPVSLSLSLQSFLLFKLTKILTLTYYKHSFALMATYAIWSFFYGFLCLKLAHFEL